MTGCCWERILNLPPGWRGMFCYCLCGNLLRLKAGIWTVEQ